MLVALIEDNEIDRLNLATLLGEHADVEIVGEAETLARAVQLINTRKPEAVFLDIHLGRQKGFRVLEQVAHLPQVVITTSHPHYAVQGFEIDAVDYLLKPVVAKTLARALARLRRYLGAEEGGRPEKLDEESMLMLRKGNDIYFIQACYIQAITGERVYTRVLLADGREFLHNRPLRKWIEILPAQFKSLDRSTILNVTEIAKVERGVKQGTSLVTFRGGKHKLEIGVTAMRTLSEIAS